MIYFEISLVVFMPNITTKYATKLAYRSLTCEAQPITIIQTKKIYLVSLNMTLAMRPLSSKVVWNS